MLVCGTKRSPGHERQKTHDGLPRNGSLHLQEEILNLTPPGQFHAGEGLATPYRFPEVSEKSIHGEGHPLNQSSHLVGNFISAELHGCEVRGVSQD